MGGIFGATARDNVVPCVMQGLADLEDWDSDSAGLAVLADHQIQRRRATGRVSFLETLLGDEPIASNTALGHVRSATHGAPSRHNAHPLASSRVAVAHSGVIENHAELRLELEGVQFRSETDSEVVVWLLDRELAVGADPVSALHAVLPRLKGSFAIALISSHHDGRLYGTGRGHRLVASRSRDSACLSSDATALGRVFQELVNLEDGQIVEARPGGVRVFDGDLREVAPRWSRIQGSRKKRESGRVLADAARQAILNLPSVLGEALQELERDLSSGELERWCGPLLRADRILAVGSGVSYHNAHVARTWLEQVALVPAEVELSSELKGRNAILEGGTVALVVAPPGEDTDTLDSLHELKQRSVPTVAVADSPTEALSHTADAVIDYASSMHLHEASPVAWITELSALAAVSIATRQQRQRDAAPIASSLFGVPQAMARALEAEGQCVAIGCRLAEANQGLFVARGISLPLARISALTLENLADIPAEGVAGGELKHRATARLELGSPVIIFAPHDDTIEKALGDAREIVARGGEPILVGDARTAEVARREGWTCLSAGRVDPVWSPIVLAVLAQLVVYHAARARGPLSGRPELPDAESQRLSSDILAG